jgi:hypothetical protein
MRPLLIPAAAALFLAACQPGNNSNTGELPADPPPTAGADELSPPPSDPTALAANTPAFVGSWSADPAWCANTTGPERAIVVTQTEFRGYENICQITELRPDGDDWNAVFVCQAEGVTSRQPVEIEADGDELEITWLDDGNQIEWRRCPA